MSMTERHGVADTGRPAADGGSAEVIELQSVDGVVVRDLASAQLCAGGTRLAPGVTATEVALLARAMTYKFAVLGEQIGGAKAGIRADPADRERRAQTIARYCDEIRPWVHAGRFLTGPDMGTFEEDFAPLRDEEAAPSAIRSLVDGVPFEDLLTGFGVVVSADTALETSGGGLEGRGVAVQGFGKAGGGVAREVVARGGRVVAISTIEGCIGDPNGLDVERLHALRSEHGDGCVTRYGLPVFPPDTLFEVETDVVVPGARPGVIDRGRAERLDDAVRVIAPAANVPYTAGGLEVLRARGVAALPDFVSNSGAVIGYRSPLDATPQQVLADVESRIADLTRESMGHPDGPMAGAIAIAARFVRTWWGDPPPPPVAPESFSI